MSKGLFTQSSAKIALTTLVVHLLLSGVSPTRLLADTPLRVLIVEGRVVPLGGAQIQMRGARLLLPVAPIARELAQDLSVDAARRQVAVHRKTSGVLAEFDANTGEVREDGLISATVPQTADIAFSPNSSDLLLPAEVVALLFDVSVSVNAEKNEVEISHASTSRESQVTVAPASRFEAQSLDYAYDLRVSGGKYVSALGIRSSGRYGSWCYSASDAFAVSPGEKVFSFRNGNLTLENSRGLRLSFGDFGSPPSLRFLSTSLRGAGFETPFMGARLSVYGGLTAGGDIRNTGQLFQQDFSTRLFGGQLGFKPLNYRSLGGGSLALFAGANYYSGPHASGKSIDSAIQYTAPRNKLFAELSAGSYSGSASSDRPAHGFGTALKLDDIFSPFRTLTFQAGYERFSPSYLTPQRSSSWNDTRTWNAAVSWQPFRILSGQFSVSDSRKITDSDQRITNYSGTLALTPSVRHFPSIFASHSISASGRRGTFSLTQITIANTFAKFRWFATVTEPAGKSVIELGPGAQPDDPRQVFVSRFSAPTINVGAGMDLSQFGSLLVTQSFAEHFTQGTLDYYAKQWFQNRVQLAAGVTYQNSSSHFSLGTRLTTSVRVTQQERLQLSITKTQAGFQLTFGLNGSLLWPHKPSLAATGIAERSRFASMRGRVYQDVNLNGRYDEGTDIPVADVGVKLDGAHVTTTGARGEYAFAEIEQGPHTVGLEYSSVRADLTLLSPNSQTVFLAALQRARADFRLIRTGGVSGIVWIDANDNGQLDPGEKCLGDVRILTSEGRDTLSDENGRFVIGDLPPGDYILFVDSRSLPPGFRSKLASLRIGVSPGKVSDNSKLPVVVQKPDPVVKEFGSSPPAQRQPDNER